MRENYKSIVLRPSKGEEDKMKLEQVAKYHKERNLKLGESIVNEDKRFFISNSPENMKAIIKSLDFLKFFYGLDISYTKSLLVKIIPYTCDIKKYENTPLTDFSKKKTNKLYIEMTESDKRIFDIEKRDMEYLMNEKLTNLEFVYQFIHQYSEVISLNYSSNTNELLAMNREYRGIANKYRDSFLNNMSIRGTTFHEEVVMAIKEHEGELGDSFRMFDAEEALEKFTIHCENIHRRINKIKSKPITDEPFRFINKERNDNQIRTRVKKLR